MKIIDEREMQRKKKQRQKRIRGTKARVKG